MKKKKQGQGNKFIQAAKEHGCDENEKAFADKLKKLSRPKSKEDKK